MTSNGSNIVPTLFAKEFNSHSYMHRLVSYMHDKYITFVSEGLQGKQSPISDLVFHWKQAQQKYIIEEIRQLQIENEKLNNQVRLLGNNPNVYRDAQEHDEIVRLRNENDSLVREVQKLRTTPTYGQIVNGAGQVVSTGQVLASSTNLLNPSIQQHLIVKNNNNANSDQLIKSEQLLRPATPPAPLQQNPHNTITLQQLKQVQNQQSLIQNLSQNVNTTTSSQQAAATAAAVQEFTISSDHLQNIYQIENNNNQNNNSQNSTQINQNNNSQQLNQISQNSQNYQNYQSSNNNSHHENQHHHSSSRENNLPHHSRNSHRSSSNRQSRQLDSRMDHPRSSRLDSRLEKNSQLPLEPKQQPITTVHLPIVIQNGQPQVTIGNSGSHSHMAMEQTQGGTILLSSQQLDDDRIENSRENTQRLTIHGNTRNLPGLSPATTTKR